MRGKFKLRIRKKNWMSGVKVPKCINVLDRLKQPGMSETLREKLDSLNFDGSWESFKEQFYRVGVHTLGYRTKTHKYWFDDNNHAIDILLKTKHALHDALLNQNHNTAIGKEYKERKATLQNCG